MTSPSADALANDTLNKQTSSRVFEDAGGVTTHRSHAGRAQLLMQSPPLFALFTVPGLRGVSKKRFSIAPTPFLEREPKRLRPL